MWIYRMIYKMADSLDVCCACTGSVHILYVHFDAILCLIYDIYFILWLYWFMIIGFLGKQKCICQTETLAFTFTHAFTGTLKISGLHPGELHGRIGDYLDFILRTSYYKGCLTSVCVQVIVPSVYSKWGRLLIAELLSTASESLGVKPVVRSLFFPSGRPRVINIKCHF